MEQPLQQCLSTNSVPRAFFPRVVIGCRLSLKIDQNLSPFWSGTLSTGAVLDRIFIFVVSNFVVITNGGGAHSLEQPISTNSVPRAFFPRVAIGCRLLGGVLIGGYMI